MRNVIIAASFVATIVVVTLILVAKLRRDQLNVHNNDQRPAKATNGSNGFELQEKLLNTTDFA